MTFSILLTLSSKPSRLWALALLCLRQSVEIAADCYYQGTLSTLNTTL
jgi:hypothetical protein